MANVILADRMITISELKRNPTHALNSAGNHPVAIMNHNKVTHYAMPAALYERIMDMVEDFQDLRTSKERENTGRIEVKLSDLATP